MHRPRRSLGQNFLVDPNLQQKIVDAIAPGPEDDVLEIGPGTGALTRRIAGLARRLVAVELDDGLAANLQAEFDARSDVTVLHRDILEVELEHITTRPDRLKVVGNIPYNITTPLIFHLLERRDRPATMVLMVQREVADRILADPGTKAYGALSVGVRTVAAAERLFNVRRTAFRPSPNVDSTVIRITPLRPQVLEPHEEEDLRTLTRCAFAWRRKQLQRILRSAPEYALEAGAIPSLASETGLDLAARPEDLAPQDFITLARALRDRERPLGTASAGQDRNTDPARRRLLGVVAHELRSPLTAIIGYQELLDDGLYGQLDQPALEAVRRIGNSARHLLTLIEGMEELVGLRSSLPDYTRPASRAAGDTNPAAARTAGMPADEALSDGAEDAIQQCLADFQREAAARNVQTEIDAPDTLTPLSGDTERVRALLELFLHAALKLALGGTLRLAVEQHEHGTSISVDGAGLDRYRLDSSVPEHDVDLAIDSGAALRLAIARRIAATLGGRVFSRDSGPEAGLVLELPG